MTCEMYAAVGRGADLQEWKRILAGHLQLGCWLCRSHGVDLKHSGYAEFVSILKLMLYLSPSHVAMLTLNCDDAAAAGTSISIVTQYDIARVQVIVMSSDAPTGPFFRSCFAIIWKCGL